MQIKTLTPHAKRFTITELLHFFERDARILLAIRWLEASAPFSFCPALFAAFAPLR
jgi:hypothetical protein